MSVSADSVFSPAEGHNLQRTGIVGMKNTSASLEALVSGSQLKVSLYNTLDLGRVEALSMPVFFFQFQFESSHF